MPVRRYGLASYPGSVSLPISASTMRVKALGRVMTDLMQDDTELFKQFMDNEGFKRWMGDAVFGLNYGRQAAQ